MKHSQIYPQVMFESIKHLSQGLKSEYQDLHIDDPLENIIGSLIISQYPNLIELVLEEKEISQKKFTEILNAYAQTQNHKKLLKLLSKFTEQEHFFNFEKYIKELLQNGSQKDILNFSNFIFIPKENRRNQHNISYIQQIITKLWENKNYDLSEKIIKNFPSAEKNIFTITLDLQKNKVPTYEEVQNSIKNISNIPLPYKGCIEWMHKRHLSQMIEFLMQELESKGYIQHLKYALYESQKQSSAQKIEKISNTYEIQELILNNYLQEESFKKAQEFIKNLNQNSQQKHFDSEIQKAQLYFSIKNKDKINHEKFLKRKIQKIESKIQEHEEKLKDKKNKDNSEDFLETSNWERKIMIKELKAKKYAEKAIFELTHKSHQDAEKSIKSMIFHTESITQNISEKTPAHHSKYFNNRRIELKRSLKKEFIKYNLFHFLPKEHGWNSMIKSEEQQKIDKTKNKIRRKKQQAEESENFKKNKTIKDKEQTKKIQNLLEQNKADEAIILFENSIFYDLQNEDAQRAILFLEYNPELFSKIFYILGKDYFEKDDYSNVQKNWKPLSQFFVKAYTLGILKENAWDDLVDKIDKSRFKVYGPNKIEHDSVISFIKNLLEIGDISQAWEFFENILTLHNKYLHKSLYEDTISSALSLFIKELETSEPKNISDNAFKNIPLPRNQTNIDLSEKIKYLNNNANIHQSFHQKKEYKNDISELQEILKTSTNPENIIRFWCKEIISNCLRSKEKITQELKIIQSSEIIISKKSERRIIYTLINSNSSISKKEIIKYITQKKISLQSQKFFLEQIIKKGYISAGTKAFLKHDLKNNIPNIIKLLKKYPHIFDFIIDKLDSFHTLYGSGEECGLDENINDFYYRVKKKQYTNFPWNAVFKSIDSIKKQDKKSFKKLKKVENSFDENLEEPLDIFKKNFGFLFNLKRNNILNSKEQKENFKKLLTYLNFDFLVKISAHKEFIQKFSQWNGDIHHFVNLFINIKFLKEYITCRDQDYERTISPFIKDDETLKIIFYNFVFLKPVPEKSDLLNNIFKKLKLQKGSKKQRKKNISDLNQKQKQFIKENHPDFNFKEFNQKHRTITLYCRYLQMPPLFWAILVKVTEKFVSEYAQCHNQIFLLPKEAKNFYQEFINPNIPGEALYQNEFRHKLSVYATPFHSTHGSPEGEEFGAIPIISHAIRGGYLAKMKHVKNFTPLNLQIDPRPETNVPTYENLFDDNLEEMIIEIIQSFLLSESSSLEMLKKIQYFNIKPKKESTKF